MKALIFILCSITFVGACGPGGPIYRQVPKDYVFKCAAPNGKGLQHILEKLHRIPLNIFGNIGYYVQVDRWFNETVTHGFAKIYHEKDYKIMMEYICKNVFVDAQFYVENMVVFIDYYAKFFKPFVTNYPQQSFGKYVAELTDSIRETKQVKNWTNTLNEAVVADGYAQLGMERILSPTLKKLLHKTLALPELKEFMQKLHEHNVNVDDVLYFYTLHATGWWEHVK